MSAPVSVRPAHVVPHRLSDLLGVIDGLSVIGDVGDVTVTGVTHDSQRIEPGDLFAAMPGHTRHGVEFVERAAAAGAVAVLTDPSGAERASAGQLPVICADDPRGVLGPVARWVYDDPASRLLVLGVTGTNGKTTSSYLMEAGLRAAGHRTGLIGTVETRVGDSVIPSQHTTPEATDLQSLFAVMLERGVTAVAMEVSSHALALSRVDGTSFAVAVFTNLSQDHLDFHPSLDDYYLAKARLFTSAFTDLAVVDVDDVYGARLATEARTRVVTVSPGGNRDADWWVDDVVSASDGSDFVLHGPGAVRTSVHTELAGAFNIANAALSVVALVEVGVPLTSAVSGVASCAYVPGRMQRVDAGQPFTAIVDYAHTPDAVTRLLSSLRAVSKGRLIVVLGCGGDRDRAKRPLMGRAVASGADVAILTSDNPRSEDPLAILAAMAEGARAVPSAERADVVVEVDRRAAIRLAVGMAGPRDVVAVAGKGHERTQETAGVLAPFDDGEELTKAIAASVRAS